MTRADTVPHSVQLWRLSSSAGVAGARKQVLQTPHCTASSAYEGRAGALLQRMEGVWSGCTDKSAPCTCLPSARDKITKNIICVASGDRTRALAARPGLGHNARGESSNARSTISASGRNLTGASAGRLPASSNLIRISLTRLYLRSGNRRFPSVRLCAAQVCQQRRIRGCRAYHSGHPFAFAHCNTTT